MQAVNLRTTLDQVAQRHPAQDVGASTLAVLAAAVEAAQIVVPDNSVVAPIAGSFPSGQRSMSAVDCLVVATQIETALRKFRPGIGIA